MHVAATRSGATLTLWINGTSAGSANIGARDYGFDGRLCLGMYGDNPAFPGNFFYGNMDEVRVTKGVCRYTAPFTPRTKPFPEG